MRKWENVGETVFQGANQVNLDAKGRMAVPARVREPLTQGGTVKLVLTAHPEGCLLLYPEPAWEPIRARVMAFPSLDRQLNLWKRLLIGFDGHDGYWDDRHRHDGHRYDGHRDDGHRDDGHRHRNVGHGHDQHELHA